MKNNIKIVLILRYLWLALSAVLIIFVIFNFFSVKAIVTYNLDFSQSVGRDIVGWYPESRISYRSSLPFEGVDLLAEPVYLKLYAAGDFELMTVSGSVITSDLYPNQDVRLGLRQQDGSWQFQSIDKRDFLVNFDLTQAKKYRNQFEMILSVPTMTGDEKLTLLNNWQIVLKK